MIRLLLAVVMLAAPATVAAQQGAAALVVASPGASADSAPVAAALRAAGTAVTAVDVADAAALRGAIDTFAAGLAAGGDVLVYVRAPAARAPARNRAEGFDNWLFGPGGVALGDLLTTLNGAGAARQVVVLDAVPIPAGDGLVQPGARALRQAVIVLGAAPGDPVPATSVLATSLARAVTTSRAPAGELMLAVAADVAATSGGRQRPMVIGSGASARWVINPTAIATVTAPAAETERALYDRAVGCGSETCLRGALGRVGGPLRADLERRLAALAALDDFDPGAPGGTAAPRARLNAEQQATVDRLGGDAIGRYRLGMMFLRGGGGLPRDVEVAMTWLDRATRMEYGPSIPNDPEKWYRDKADFVLGWLTLVGQGPVARNVEGTIARWGRFNSSPDDPDTAWYLGQLTEQCVGQVNSCQKSVAQSLYARARAGGVTRARSPLDPDFPQEKPR